MLPGETNLPLADGTIQSSGTSNGNATITNTNATNVSAADGERPGFDPRMSSYPYTIQFLDGSAAGQILNVSSVSQDILSFANSTAFASHLTLNGSANIGSSVVFYGTPDQSQLGTLSWKQAVVDFSGMAKIGDVWTLVLNGVSYSAPAGDRPDRRAVDPRRRDPGRDPAAVAGCLQRIDRRRPPRQRRAAHRPGSTIRRSPRSSRQRRGQRQRHGQRHAVLRRRPRRRLRRDLDARLVSLHLGPRRHVGALLRRSHDGGRVRDDDRRPDDRAGGRHHLRLQAARLRQHGHVRHRVARCSAGGRRRLPRRAAEPEHDASTSRSRSTR